MQGQAEDEVTLSLHKRIDAQVLEKAPWSQKGFVGNKEKRFRDYWVHEGRGIGAGSEGLLHVQTPPNDGRNSLRGAGKTVTHVAGKATLCGLEEEVGAIICLLHGKMVTLQINSIRRNGKCNDDSRENRRTREERGKHELPSPVLAGNEHVRLWNERLGNRVHLSVLGKGVMNARTIAPNREIAVVAGDVQGKAVLRNGKMRKQFVNSIAAQKIYRGPVQNVDYKKRIRENGKLEVIRRNARSVERKG